jgi:DUF1680 family protein
VVNLFLPSVLNWLQRNLTVTQTTDFPLNDTTTLKISGSGIGFWTMRIRIPSWTSNVRIAINGRLVENVTANPGTYAEISRVWTGGDTLSLQLPMRLQTVAANDNKDVAALMYGPVVLSGNYGSENLKGLPSLDLGSVRRSSEALGFTAQASNRKVSLGPFFDAHSINYNIYWSVNGALRVL